MKCLLLLLASGLVTSDKLDRTYLPPPGATYSGGTVDDLRLPLEFRKEKYMGAFQNPEGFDPTMTFTEFYNDQNSGKGVPVGNSAFIFPNNFSPVTQFMNNEYQTTVPTSTPVPSFYGSFPSNSPSFRYLPSKPSTIGTQSDFFAQSRPGFDGIVTTSTLMPYVDQKDTENNYYFPNIPTQRNNIVNQGPDNYEFQNVGTVQLPNKVNSGRILGTKIINANDANQNYQPNLFGYYGGTPMIMTNQNVYPQEFEGIDVTSKFYAAEKNMPSLLKQEYLNNKIKISEGPLQPIIQLESNNVFKPTDSKTTTTMSNKNPSTYPSETTNFDKKLPLLLEQRNEMPKSIAFKKQRPQMESETNAVIINYENNVSPESYSYRYDTSNGIHADETGMATNGVRTKGSYSYTSDDGKTYTVTYTADENGFQPRGDHLPTAPPIPEAIQRVIDQAAKDKEAGIIDDGSYDEQKYGHINYQGAMDRYIPFEINRGKTSRLSSNGRKPTRFHQNKNKSKFDDKSFYNGIVSKTNDLAIENPNILPAAMENNANIDESGDTKNQLSDETELSTENRLKNREKNQRRPIAFLNDDEFIPIDKIKMMTDARIKTEYETPNTPIFNDKDQIIQNEIPFTSSKSAVTTDGYFYVPPVTKFNSNPKKPTNEKNFYLSSDKTIPITIDTDTNKRAGFNDSRTVINMDKKDSYTDIPFIGNTVTAEPTRQPYISGPDEQNKQMNDNSETNDFSKTDINLPTSSTNNLDTMYSVNTTPMTTQTVQKSQNTDQNSQYYPFTTSPSMFDEALSNVENRINIPSVNPGITVSQDLVTTTYRPSISGDGVLEVNQNVKIYGIGSPDTTDAFNGYSDRIPDNNPFYSVTTLNGKPTAHGEYLNSFYPGPTQDTKVFLGKTNKYVPYGNGYSTRVPIADRDRTSGPYFNTGFGRVPQGGTSVEPNTLIFNSSKFGNSEKNPVQETSPFISNQNQKPGDKIIVEDFSGPRQPQNFDPKTGYYYK